MTKADCLAKIKNHNHLIDKIMTSNKDSNLKIKVELLFPFEYINKYEVICRISGDIQEGSMSFDQLLANFHL